MPEAAQAQGVVCPICGWSGPEFAPMGRARRPNAQCPECHSLERHRAMLLYLRDETAVFKERTRLLHFAPEPTLRRVFDGRDNIEYVTTDLEMPDVSMRMDIHELLFRDEVFDFVICSHVLEHVEDDRAAMREIRRVLRRQGTALVMVPILPTPDGRTFEDPTITTPEDRERAYGQADHVRLYGDDFAERARDTGFDVEVFRPAERWGSKAASNALSQRDVFFVCRGGELAPERGEAPARAAKGLPNSEPVAAPSDLWFETQISPHDAMARPERLDHYFRVGLGALRLVEDALRLAQAPAPASILDLPCGYGRVLRMLTSRFPEAAVTACDLDRRAVEFCERTFGVQGTVSEAQLDELSLPQTYALIWCGSLLTHLPEAELLAALGAFQRHLDPGGILVCTTHGQRIRDMLGAGRAFAHVDGSAKASLEKNYDARGFGFVPYPHSADGSYGFALASRDWMEETVSQVSGLSHFVTWEAAWDERQDVYVCQRVKD